MLLSAGKCDPASCDVNIHNNVMKKIVLFLCSLEIIELFFFKFEHT